MAATVSSAVQCEGYDCSSGSDVIHSLCLSCGSTYCEVCWPRQGPHRPGKVGVDGLPHEKTVPQVYERLRAVLQPPEDPDELLRLHTEDEETTWFGVVKDDEGKTIFHDHNRYNSLMIQTKQPQIKLRYPQLVTFIGSTGAGKSTIIKMLVSLKENEQNTVSGIASPFQSPIAGSAKNDISPTSGDVHLYMDPASAYGQSPMLYADCEGLDGGEAVPVSLEVMKRNQKTRGTLNSSTGPKKIFKGKGRELTYAKTNTEAQKREWAVRKLYPRLLYTFSDAIVFVLRNTRSFESSVLSLLVEWASTSLEASVNQPVLPHAIIAINSVSTDIEDKEWKISTATDSLMTHVAGAINDKPFKHLAEQWRQKGRVIHNMRDLIRCYYADIKVVRIPIKGRYMRMNDQVNKLHREIIQACDGALTTKMNTHMVSDADELHTYLQAGFDHFTSHESEPFNFVNVALKNNPVPRDFGDHILNLARIVHRMTRLQNGAELFGNMSSIVASCIAIDCVRQHRPGKALNLFDRFYATPCVAALEHFCDKYWPCEFKVKNKRCINVKSVHSAKGHQAASGKIIADGPYVSNFTPFNFASKWLDSIKAHLQRIDDSLSKLQVIGLQTSADPSNISNSAHAYTLHQRYVENFYTSYREVRPFHFISYTTCLCCLMEIPQHPLSCGHILCTACVKAFGKLKDLNTVEMNMCPLHGRFAQPQPWAIHFKPKFAGVRILTLDGGGVRGIVELQVLKAIERAMGGDLPIQAFFDLIIGTSTGGILALGLGVKKWPLEQCSSEFIRLCDQAFTPRALQSVKGLSTAITMVSGSKYKTSSLWDALKAVFGSEWLYGGQQKAHAAYHTKVAVTSASGTGDKSVVFANYTRQEDTETDYDFELVHRLKVWEAAAATSAAPSYFKPFRRVNAEGMPIGKEYIDGAVYYNNPVQVAHMERKMLWPDVAESAPDILLSLGTGKNAAAIEKELLGLQFNAETATYGDPPISSQDAGTRIKDNISRKAKNKLIENRKARFMPKLWATMLFTRIDKTLDAEAEWRRFYNDVNSTHEVEDFQERYRRINVDLAREPPKLDEKSQVTILQSEVTSLLKTEYQPIIESVAHRLIATAFYFDKEECNIVEKTTDSCFCKGRIICRFAGSSAEHRENMRALGTFLAHQQVPGHQPYFTIKEKCTDADAQKIDITERIIDGMAKRAEFALSQPMSIVSHSPNSSITIYLALLAKGGSEPKLYPISGFPRRLFTEDSINEVRLDKREAIIRNRRYGGLHIARDPKIADPARPDLTKVDSGEDSVKERTTSPSTSEGDLTTRSIRSEARVESPKLRHKGTSLASLKRNREKPQLAPESRLLNESGTEEDSSNEVSEDETTETESLFTGDGKSSLSS